MAIVSNTFSSALNRVGSPPNSSITADTAKAILADTRIGKSSHHIEKIEEHLKALSREDPITANLVRQDVMKALSPLEKGQLESVGAGEIQSTQDKYRHSDRMIIDSLNEDQVQGTGPYAIPDTSASPELLSSRNGRRLGPNDTYGRIEIPLDGDVIEDSIPRNIRIDRVLSLLDRRDYQTLIRENFSMNRNSSLSETNFRNDTATINTALTELLATNVGRRMLITIAHKGIDVQVDVNRNGNNESTLNSGRVYIDATSVNQINREWALPNGRAVPFRLSVVIAHELGHSLLGYNDNVTSLRGAIALRTVNGGRINDPVSLRNGLLAQGDNVRNIENPLRSELGLPLRPSYNNPHHVRRWFPELFR
jgi:hypothetical protein